MALEHQNILFDILEYRTIQIHYLHCITQLFTIQIHYLHLNYFFLSTEHILKIVDIDYDKYFIAYFCNFNEKSHSHVGEEFQIYSYMIMLFYITSRENFGDWSGERSVLTLDSLSLSWRDTAWRCKKNHIVFGCGGGVIQICVLF